MNITKLLAVTIFSVVLFSACSKSADENTPKSLRPIRVSMTVANVSLDAENSLESIAVYCFAKKPGSTEYTFEKKIPNLTPVNNTNGDVVTWNLDGSLQRQFYFVANEDEKIVVSNLTPATTTVQFEKNIHIIDAQQPKLPFVLSSKSVQLTSGNQVEINTEFTHVLSCLDVSNQYTGFTLDSLVLENAESGAYLYDKANLSDAISPKTTINHLTATKIYMYPTKAANLAVFGKYKAIRVAFDIPLPTIERATKYKVIFKSINDQTVGFENNLSWNIIKWQPGENTDSTPDWN